MQIVPCYVLFRAYWAAPKVANPGLIEQICSTGQWICFGVSSKKIIKSSE